MKRKWEGKESEMAVPTSSSCDDGSGRGYEVFLNFRGPDTHLTIADCLYNDMIRAGIRAFKDNEELRFGEEIEEGLLQAINESRIYIPIFSKDYASSKWCLRELARILELSRDDHEKVILPIFFDVDADDVKLKTNLYRKALRKHKTEYGKDFAEKWKKALREVARIRGRNLKDHGLHKLTNLMVEEVSSLLWTRLPDVPNHLVGIEDRRDHVMKLLDLGAVDVRYIVIHGMGGIGKTTLADVIFRQISPEFQDRCCFLKDVRTHDILDLQKKLLSDILHLRCTDLSAAKVDDMIKTRFRGKKVLIVLDDINNQDQIKKLADEPNWFGGGSRIIVTTRNIEFLEAECDDDSILESHHGNFSFYEMVEMNRDDALQLFCERALGLAKPPFDYMNISGDLVNALGGLPLALDVIGSTLRGKSRSRWDHVLQKLKQVLNEDVKKKLIISYEALDSCQQQIYLDIACFFINQEKITAIKYWDAVFGYSTEIEIKILRRMSLIKIIKGDKLWMHDQLRDLGRHIVCPESHEIHLRGSRLWSPKDAFRVVQSKMGNENIVALNLGMPESDVTYIFKRKEFARMVNLRFVQLDRGNFEGDFKDIFLELRWLSWSNCPSKFQATNFGLKNLVVLNLSGRNITEDWGGWCQIMVSQQLKVLQLEYCPSLRKMLKFSPTLRLERLILRCPQLREIDESIGSLKSLTELRIRSQRLSVLPYSIGNLVKLKHLILTCGELRELPDSIGQLELLIELDINDTRIKELPYSIGKLERLKIFMLPRLSLEKLPNSIGRLQSLVELDMKDSTIKILPDCVGNLKKLKVLNLHCSSISELPKTIGMLENLEELRAQRALKREIPSEIGALSSLKILDLSGGEFGGLPATINQLTNLQELDLEGCHSIHRLPELPKSLTSLKMSSKSMTTIPDFSNLTNLVSLLIVGSSVEEPNIEGLLRLSALRSLTLRVGKGTWPPADFSSLSQLQELQISYADSRSLTRLPSSLRTLMLEDVQSAIDWSLFSNLENLSSLSIGGYSLTEVMLDRPLLKTLTAPPCLKEIRCLILERLPQLAEIQDLGELKSLQELRIRDCNSIKSLDLSNLRNLKRLDFWRCESLEHVLGVPESCKLDVENCPWFNKDG
ncbi:disease resistance protein RPV1-like [Rhodamnia argentea]|uniref:Disease resistance protein RPV1-like n=1 Tax=Rhodamnia argentea TaxID=178133 RepID=A0ABM3H585_9MYRT|nr:disease resistance protein RPV1-like [Rhodamnia argentea]